MEPVERHFQKNPQRLLSRALEDVRQATSPQLRRYLALRPLHDAQDLFFRSVAPRVFLVGPNVIGKTPISMCRLIAHTTGMLPFFYRDGTFAPRARELAGGRPASWVVLGISRDQMEGAAWGVLKEWLPPEFIYEPTARKIILKRFVYEEEGAAPRILDEPGVSIHHRTVEARRLRQQGGQFDGVAIDEEHETVDVYNEYGIQVGKRDGWIQGTITPEESRKKGGNTWFAKEIWFPAIAARVAGERVVHLDRRTDVVFGRRGDQIDALTGQLMTDDQIRDRLESACSTEAERRLRIDGEYDPTPAQPYYSEAATTRMLVRLTHTEVVEPRYTRGRILPDGRGEPRFTEASDAGYLWVYSWPKRGERYIVGTDPATGEGHDLTAAVVWARRSSHVAAVFHAKMEPDLYKEPIYLLARHYREAWVVNESGGYGGTLMSYLRERYAHRLMRRTTSPSTPKVKIGKFGLSPQAHETRVRVIERINRELVAGTADFRHAPLVREIIQFGWVAAHGWSKPRPDHPRGGHDDLLFALGYALIGSDECPIEDEDPEETVRADETAAEAVQRRTQKHLDDYFAALAAGHGPPPFDPLGLRRLTGADPVYNLKPE